MSRDVKGYWSPRDKEDVSTGRNMCLMEKKSIKCDEGYWSSSSEEDNEDAELNFCYMETNDPLGRSILQHVRSMITENNFDLSLCDRYLIQI